MAIPIKLPTNYCALPDHKLREIELTMQSRIADIQYQLSDPAKNKEDNECRDWKRRASLSLRAYEVDLIRIRHELAHRKSGAIPRPERIESLFFDIARRRLNREVFTSIYNEAKEEYAHGQ